MSKAKIVVFSRVMEGAVGCRCWTAAVVVRWLVGLAVSLWGGVSAASEVLEHLTFSQMPVAEVLHRYEAEGYRFIYSSDLVKKGARFQWEPPAVAPVERLRLGLQRLGLTLRSSKGDNHWLIVRIPLKGRRLSGVITDAGTQQPLRDVRISVDGHSVYTDAAGRFEIIIPVEDSHLLISHSGYVEQQLVPRPPALEADDWVIPLNPLATIEEVVVTGSRYALKKSARLSRHQFDADELIAVPELGDDALRATSHLPGTASSGLSAQPYIRGGLRDETLVLFNHVELLEPFHMKDFQSVFSGLNPRLIKSIDVYTGGFPAKYGDKMSGVIDIAPVEDLPRLGGEVLLSFLTTAAAGYGVFAEGRGNWVLSGRRGNLDVVTDKVNPTLGEPSYSDGFGQLSWQLNSDLELRAGALVYNDDVELMDLETEEGEVAGELTHSSYRNAYGWLQLHQQIGEQDYAISSLSVGSIRHQRDGFVAESEEGDSHFLDSRWFKIWSLSHQQYRTLSYGIKADFGGRLNYQEGSYRADVDVQRGDLARLLEVPAVVEHHTRLTPQGFSGGLYGSLLFEPQPWLLLETGLRWDFQDYQSEVAGGTIGRGVQDGERKFHDQFSPRLSARFTLGPQTHVRASLGRFYQPEYIHELQVADGVTGYQSAQYTNAYVLGLDQGVGDTGLKLRLEAFYKDVRNPKRRFENLVNALVLMPELSSDRIEVAPDKARASGFEATLSYNPDKALNLWLSYTQASADDRINGEWQPRTWDQARTLAGGWIWNLDNWAFSGALRWHSGWQTTELPNHVDTLEPLSYRRNRDHLPAFLSVDLRASRRWDWSDQSLTFYVELTNVFNRDNVGAVEYSLTEAEAGGYDLLAEDELLLPLVPSIGVQWQFESAK